MAAKLSFKGCLHSQRVGVRAQKRQGLEVGYLPSVLWNSWTHLTVGMARSCHPEYGQKEERKTDPGVCPADRGLSLPGLLPVLLVCEAFIRTEVLHPQATEQGLAHGKPSTLVERRNICRFPLLAHSSACKTLTNPFFSNAK